VSENIGVLSLLVVRAQGILGFVSAEWKTVDGTAKSSGKVAFDYVVRVPLLIAIYISCCLVIFFQM